MFRRKDDPFKALKPKKSKARVVTSLVCFCLVLTCVYIIIDETTPWIGELKYAIIGLISDEENGKEEISKNMSEINATYQLQYDKFKKMNNEVVAYLDIPKANISYPVLQAPNNQFYLEHDILKNPDKSGSIFMDCDVKLGVSDNTIIHGHNMWNSTMFSDLDKYLDQNYRNSAPYINLFVPGEGTRTYEVIQASKINEKDRIFRLYLAWIRWENKKIDATSYLANFSKYAAYTLSDGVKRSTDLITLSTCERSYDNTRVVVVGKLIHTEEI